MMSEEAFAELLKTKEAIDVLCEPMSLAVENITIGFRDYLVSVQSELARACIREYGERYRVLKSPAKAKKKTKSEAPK